MRRRPALTPVPVLTSVPALTPVPALTSALTPVPAPAPGVRREGAKLSPKPSRASSRGRGGFSASGAGDDRGVVGGHGGGGVRSG
ncbi:hypothetical protein GCM10023335_68940 [Streptomyces siamensis]|uniref:Secreted protein n=1 Tax=Streptomyces siamensis TaxID=1274986 RepID=A0ABP9JEN7_9ACTN